MSPDPSPFPVYKQGYGYRWNRWLFIENTVQKQLETVNEEEGTEMIDMQCWDADGVAWSTGGGAQARRPV